MKKINVKKLQIVALLTLTLGWIPFMWIAIWGSWRVGTIGLCIFILGLLLCLASSLIIGGLLSKKALWLNQREFEKEIQKFRDAKVKYEKATLEIVKLQKLQ